MSETDGCQNGIMTTGLTANMVLIGTATVYSYGYRSVYGPVQPVYGQCTASVRHGLSMYSMASHPIASHPMASHPMASHPMVSHPMANLTQSMSI